MFIKVVVSLFMILTTLNVSAQKNNGILFDDAVQIDSSEWFLIPERIGGETVEYGKGKGYVSGGDYKEVMVYNANTGNFKNLFAGKKVIISNFQQVIRDYRNPNAGTVISNILEGQIVLSVRSENTNNDGGLDSDDPAYIFIVNMNGEGLRQITPSGLHVREWKYYSSRNMILARIQKDSDNNKKFDHRDDEFFYRIDLLPDISKIAAVQITQ